VEAGLCPLAQHTDHWFCHQSAAYCGAVALKATYERVSRRGVIPLSPSLDHVGIFAQDISTAKRAASTVCKDWDEPISLKEKPILGIPEGSYLAAASESALAHFNATCDSLADAGYELRRVRVLHNIQEVRARHDDHSC
jgi:Asp-tRNA(Asn)/Glu-tRNA(Gln) amidotransferase A subunit family amidase